MTLDEKDIKGIIESDLFSRMLEDKVNERMKRLQPMQDLTVKQFAKLRQVSEWTIYRMSAEDIKKLGYERKKVGYQTRFSKL